jgi:hypothetical protein
MTHMMRTRLPSLAKMMTEMNPSAVMRSQADDAHGDVDEAPIDH